MQLMTLSCSIRMLCRISFSEGIRTDPHSHKHKTIPFYMDSTNRVGTNVDHVEDLKTTVHALREYIVNIDFCGDNQEVIEDRATNLAVLGRSFLQ